MKIIFFHSFLFIFIIYLHGFILLKKILKFKKTHNFYEVSLIGLIITIIIAQFINFFIPLDDNLLILNIFLLCLYLFFFRKDFKNNQKIDLKILSILAILSFANIYGSNFSDDLNHYHYSSIINADKSNFIWGQNFLHPLFGTASSWLIGHSYFNFDQYRLQDIHVLNGIVFFLVMGCFFSELYTSNKNKIYHPIFFSILLFIILKYTRLKEFGIDRPATLIFCFLIYFYIKYFLDIEKKEITQNFIIIFILSIFLYSIKIIHLPILLFPLFILMRNKSILIKKNTKYLLIVLAISVLLMKNLLGTGCLIYPLDISCIEYLSWSDPTSVKKFSIATEIFNKSWYSYTGELSEENYIKNFNWINTWYFRIQSEIIEIFLTLGLIIIFSFFLFDYKSRKIHSPNINFRYFNIVLFLIIFFSSLIFFLKNPVIRMNHFVFISFMILLISLFFNFNLKKRNINFITFVLLVGIIFNCYKNINRILENNFINDPYSMISDKVTIQKKRNLDNFNYYVGWYGKAPISNNEIKDRKFKKIFLFKVIY